MKNSRKDQPETEKQKMDNKLAVINKANECSVLMTLLCEKMGLVPTNTTHQVFVETFAELQRKSLEYQKELQEIYISSSQVKTRKKRVSKTFKESVMYKETDDPNEESRSTDLAEMEGIDTDQEPERVKEETYFEKIGREYQEKLKTDEYQRGNYI